MGPYNLITTYRINLPRHLSKWRLAFASSFALFLVDSRQVFGGRLSIGVSVTVSREVEVSLSPNQERCQRRLSPEISRSWRVTCRLRFKDVFLHLINLKHAQCIICLIVLTLVMAR